LIFGVLPFITIDILETEALALIEAISWVEVRHEQNPDIADSRK
jgi:hypothetical protein